MMLLSSLFVLLLGSVAWSFQTNSDRPNIVLILADDLGYHDIGYKNPKIFTPHIDKLARRGRIFTQSYFQSSCTPSRAALLTAIYPHRLQIERELGLDFAHCLPTNVKLLPKYLKEAAGYRTHFLGKWNLGHCQEKCLPQNRGFDTVEGMYGGMQAYYNHTDRRGFNNYDWHVGTEPDKTALGKYFTTLITDKARKILEDHNPSDGPFFMELAHQAPHMPLEAPDNYENMYHHEPDSRRRTYLAQISQLDHEVGRLVASLKSNGHYENTIILFSSDNGGEGVMGPSDNTPLRGTKASLFDGGTRVLSFVSGPPVENSGTYHDGLLHAVDWLPSILGMAGIDSSIYAGENIDGIDQSGMFLRGEPSQREEVLIQLNTRPASIIGHMAIRIGDYKLLWGYRGLGDGHGRDLFLPCDPNYDIVPEGFDPVDDIEQPYRKFYSPAYGQAFVAASLAAAPDLNNLNSGETRFFNLKVDPGERVNLANATEHQARIISMKQRLIEHAQNNNPMPFTRRTADALAAMVDGTWYHGWCEDLDITIPK